MQLALKTWHALPSIVSSAHIPILHTFQQFVELQEAGQIQDNLLGTVAGNIELKSQELKGILLTWRERLPNVWDDINLWSDLVAWRQHVFTTINKSYLPLIPPLSQSSGTGNPTSSHAYRGYHETAWIINRFSHVARKHQLTDVCIASLSKIYTLPNIEIPEAFFKLREQAKCHFQSPAEYSTGLDVINNTNLHYFSQPQKAEFFTLKGIFLSKLNLHEDANVAFSSATQIDMSLPKAWAAWGQYNDRLFKEQPKEMKFGVNAVNCYMQAAWLYNNARSRKYLARILWLLSQDDAQQSLSKSYETYKGDIPLWYWITFIPQLLTALSNKEARYARTVLMKLAKSFPQVS
jgi:transformation/transcription domain-associated protein